MPYDLIGWILETIFFMKDVTKKEPDPETEECLCKNILERLHSWFAEERYQNYPCCKALERAWGWLVKCYNCICPCNKDKNFENKWLPHNLEVILNREGAEQHCRPPIHFYMNRLGVYSLICTCVWCAFVAFFEAVILGYAIVMNGNTACPVPKRASDTTIVDCFSYNNAFDTTPANKTFPSQCNGTSRLTFTGAWAGCYAWIYADVAVVDVIEQLGICSGIIAFIGSTVAIMSYLCRQHGWRLFFDIVAYLAIAAIPILINYDGSVPFLTYSLLISLFISIAITEYLLGCIPLLTEICIAHMAYKRIRKCIKSVTQSTVTPSIERDHNSEA
jgi:hypothetical protein